MVYTPGHRGIAPNAVADAIAKAYLGAKAPARDPHSALKFGEELRA
jgi:hypothetical protein